MKLTSKLACLSLVAAMATACGASGHYDSRGNYHYDNVRDSSYDNSYDRTYDHGYNDTRTAPYKEGDNFYVDHAAVRGDSSKVPGYDHNLDGDRAPYSRVGFYDRNGYYTTMANGPRIPRSYVPPRGACRIWLADRAPTEQPAVESCVGIQDRLPDGAWVVYGG